MKTNRFLAFLAVAAMAAAAVSCKKEEKEPDLPPEPVKSTECKLLTLALKSGDLRIESFVYEEDKVAEVTYMPIQYAPLAAASAEVTLSEKATIAPDPAEVRDYTVEGGVEFTVTAEDGKTKQAYKVVLKAAEITVTCKNVWTKTFGDLGISSATAGAAGFANVGFSGDKFVTRNLEVLDLEGRKVGRLNVDGIVGHDADHFGFMCVTSDHAHHLIASVGYTDGGAKYEGNPDNPISYTRVYIWEQGWDKAPDLLYENKEADLSRYISAGGDLPKEGILMIKAGPSATQMHHCDVFKDGKLAWNAFKTTYPGNDGNWGAVVSPASGSIEGTFFIADSRKTPHGIDVYSRAGINGKDVQLSGSMVDDGTVEKQFGGDNQYGNYSTGHARGFMLNGRPYAAIASSGWPSTYLTIQSANPEDEDHFLLRTVVFTAAAPVPCSAVYSAPDGDVYVLLSTQSATPLMALFKITTEAV